MLRSFAAVLVLAVGLAGCQTQQSESAHRTPDGSAPLFEGLGSHTRKITTRSTLAQRYFNQGLTLAYAFNHDEAIRSFTQATRHDPDCAMAWWGIALCHGPHINNAAMTPEASAAAWAALEKAMACAPAASDREQALITALSRRYANPTPDDRIPLDRAYADAMRRVRNAYPDDADIGCLFAESMMDLRPWDLWTSDGQPQPGTADTLAALERVLAIDPQHPGANHLYIHAVEASPDPTRGVRSAHRLRTLVPASGHLVHMPAHIDVRVGEWEQASECNRRAIVADANYRRVVPNQGFYRLYMAHNHHFLAFACMMQGRSEEALSAARDMMAGIPPEAIQNQGAMLDPYTAIVTEVQMRFGQWDAILKEPQPPEQLPITRAMWRFARAVAYASKHDLDAARSEQQAFRDAVAAVPADAMMAINKADAVLSIADNMLEGEIAYAEGRVDAAVAKLREAVAIEDTLRYMEPPDWIQPVRHPLGAMLLEAGRYEEAEAVYRADLVRWPENGWSLYGLAKSLRAQGKATEAEQVDRRFRKTWARADTTIGASCLCVQPKS
jgi:tetratricopeptide (TPR) repeat protein